MANYFYKWTPLFVLGTIVLLGLPWLGLFALIFVAVLLVGALATVALGIAWAIGTVGRAVSHGRRRQSGTSLAMRPALPRMPIGTAVVLAVRAFRRFPAT